LTSLTAAVVRAGLVDALSSEGPLTLFAPNNEAFAALDSELRFQLFENDEFIPQLEDLLLFHVVFGLLLAEALESDPGIDDLVFIALNGEPLFFASPPLTVNTDNNVVDGDNIVSNGVVHIIDGVLLPIWVFNSLTDFVNSADDLSTLFSLLVLAEIDLSGPSAVTVVGPTNDAFALLDPEVVAFLQTTDGLPQLKSILNYHVFFGILTSSILVDGFVATLEGNLLVEVSGKSGDTLRFNEANAVELDILANNGVLYKIDEVLDPNDSPVV
jgi:transforming growth factor-beta-induced protein